MVYSDCSQATCIVMLQAHPIVIAETVLDIMLHDHRALLRLPTPAVIVSLPVPLTAALIMAMIIPALLLTWTTVLTTLMSVIPICICRALAQHQSYGDRAQG